jgi:pimeloyl-ACP methyl ester carboxylesterase
VTAAAVEVGGLSVEMLDLPAPGGGAAAPLVLLHEGLGSVGLWRDFPAQLQAATGRRLIAFSRFGHGRSAPPAHRRTPAFFHEEALEVLPELLTMTDVEAPVLVGHSDGASIALIHAARHPVSAVALLAPHVFVEEMCVSAIRETREAYVSGGLRERMSRHHEDPDAAFWGWCDVWLDPAFRSWSLKEEASRLTAPALLVQGAEDPYGSLAQLHQIEARARGPVTRVVLPGGHSPHLEHGRDVAGHIAAFLREQTG